MVRRKSRWRRRTDTVHEFRERAARELKAARHAKSEPERQTHQSIANAYKALAESEAWLEGRIKPIGDKFVRDRTERGGGQ